jgi:hypothetical protein
VNVFWLKAPAPWSLNVRVIFREAPPALHWAYTVISAVTGVDAVKAIPPPPDTVFQPIKL